jgi:hypothetical protein
MWNNPRTYVLFSVFYVMPFSTFFLEKNNLGIWKER